MATKCDRCGLEESSLGRRDLTGRWWTASETEAATRTQIIDAFGRVPAGWSRVVVTSIDTDNGPRHLCQRCQFNETKGV